MELEDRYNLKIPDEATNEIRTVGQAIDYVHTNYKE